MPTIPDDTKIPHSIRVQGRLTTAGNPGKCTHLSYGMSCADYDALEERSGGCCEICGVVPQYPQIDHDHEAGWNAVRGFLCAKCNAHMRRVDSGERPIDDATAHYITHPFWAERGMQAVSESTAIYTALIPEWLKVEAAKMANENGMSLTHVIRVALLVYVKGGKK